MCVSQRTTRMDEVCRRRKERGAGRGGAISDPIYKVEGKGQKLLGAELASVIPSLSPPPPLRYAECFRMDVMLRSATYFPSTMNPFLGLEDSEQHTTSGIFVCQSYEH